MTHNLSLVGLRPAEDDSSRVDALKGLLSLSGIDPHLYSSRSHRSSQGRVLPPRRRGFDLQPAQERHGGHLLAVLLPLRPRLGARVQHLSTPTLRWANWKNGWLLSAPPSTGSKDLRRLFCSDMFNRLCQMHLETESDGEQDSMAVFANYNPGETTCTTGFEKDGSML